MTDQATTTEAPVRTAVAADEEAIMALCRMLHEENGQFAMSEDKVRHALRQAFDRKGGIVGVIDGPNGLEGVIFLIIAQLWYSDAWMLEEMFNFVHPDHRRSRHAKRLIEYAKECSNHIGVPLMVGVLSNTRTEAKVRLYERMLPKSGAYFIYNGSERAH
jgi:GNAT superfamily N-acetyltransferase